MFLLIHWVEKVLAGPVHKLHVSIRFVGLNSSTSVAFPGMAVVFLSESGAISWAKTLGWIKSKTETGWALDTLSSFWSTETLANSFVIQPPQPLPTLTTIHSYHDEFSFIPRTKINSSLIKLPFARPLVSAMREPIYHLWTHHAPHWTTVCFLFSWTFSLPFSLSYPQIILRGN